MTRKGEVADGIRRGLGEIENALFDDLLAGRIDRRTFLRHGVGLGVLSSFLAPANAGDMRDDLGRGDDQESRTMEQATQAAAASVPLSGAGSPILALLVVVVATIAVIAILAAVVFYTKSISDKQLEQLLKYYENKQGATGNVIWQYGSIVGNHALRRNEFWSSTIQIIGAIVVVAILSVLLIYKVISAEAALPIISAVSGFGLSRASNLNQSDTAKPEKAE